MPSTLHRLSDSQITQTLVGDEVLPLLPLRRPMWLDSVDLQDCAWLVPSDYAHEGLAVRDVVMGRDVTDIWLVLYSYAPKHQAIHVASALVPWIRARHEDSFGEWSPQMSDAAFDKAYEFGWNLVKVQDWEDEHTWMALHGRTVIVPPADVMLAIIQEALLADDRQAQ